MSYFGNTGCDYVTVLLITYRFSHCKEKKSRLKMNTGELIVRTESIYLIKLDIILYYSIQATPAAAPHKRP